MSSLAPCSPFGRGVGGVRPKIPLLDAGWGDRSWICEGSGVLRPVVLKLEHASESPGRLIKEISGERELRGPPAERAGALRREKEEDLTPKSNSVGS